MTEPVSVSRRIEVPAAVIFAILADPARHPEIDGSGMVRAADSPPVEKAGDAFVMRMSNDFLGDYVVTNRVVEFERDRLITWIPELTEASRPEHQARVGRPGTVRWSYALAPDGDGATIVTETYDCSRAPEQTRKRVRDGELWRDGMRQSLENLERLATQEHASR